MERNRLQGIVSTAIDLLRKFDISNDEFREAFDAATTGEDPLGGTSDGGGTEIQSNLGSTGAMSEEGVEDPTLGEDESDDTAGVDSAEEENNEES